MPELSGLNIFSSSVSGGTAVAQGSFAKIMIIFVIIFLVVGLIGGLIFMMINKRRYYITIELYKLVDGQNKIVAKFKAREHSIGRAGDKLWCVQKIGKYIPPGTLQSGPNIYKYFQRSDGEWINFCIGNIDEQMKKANVHYIDNDMRAQRIAISKSLEAELKDQGFWDKYGATITFILEILIFGVACVIIFYQFSEVVGKMDQVMGSMNKVVTNINSFYGNVSSGAGRPPIYIPST